MSCMMSATYVGSTKDIIAPSALISVTYPPLARAATRTSNDNQKNHEMPIRGSLRHLFIRPNKVSCSIVVFPVLAALTHRHTSSLYPTAEEKLPGRSEVEVECGRGSQRYVLARAAMCAYKFDLTPVTFLPGRRTTAQDHGRGY